jgi:hypothetical protein
MFAITGCINELRQLYNEGYDDYFRDWAVINDNLNNWVYNIAIIISVVIISFVVDTPDDFYKTNNYRGWLIFGLGLLGWNCINMLTIYNQFRVEVALIR